ncbi:MAG: hypothetical protein [Wendovervirus sonii]|uniref:Uncharacterized protein n=1 Tax=phage Lak_Megaphage_Sonny TaxID=3109229 RepID=A0ABZ0Z387_9CAUD|nr:MAG: hypothetical protein [phage Lak_Megaphage_Sonny]
MKIQSVSDIITNSSSEVFMVINDNQVKGLKEVISKMLKAFGNISEPIDEILEIKKIYNYQAEENINTLILHGYISDTVWECWNDGFLNENWQKVEGYPVCSSKSEITDEIFEKAASIYIEKMGSYYEESDCGPIYTDLQIISKKPEYDEIVKNINELLHFINYEVYSC